MHCILITYIQWFTEIGPKLSAINCASRSILSPQNLPEPALPHTQLPDDQNNRKIVEHKVD